MVFTHTLRRSFAVISIVLTIAPVLLLSACKNADPPPHKAVTDMKEFMSWVIDPAAVALWASVGTVVTKDGEQKIAPQTDEEWAIARHNAAVVAEAGNLLMLDGRAVDREAWMLAARGLIDKGERAMQAAAAKDADALFSANSDLYLACTECHKTYALGAQSAGASASAAKN